MSDEKTLNIHPVVSAFMQAQASDARMQCLVQIRVEDIQKPRPVDNSRVGQVAPQGYTIMPKVGLSVYDMHEAGDRERQLYRRLVTNGNLGTGHQRALFAGGLDMKLTAAELSIVTTWNDLVGAVSPSDGRFVLVAVPPHWAPPAPGV